jgi:tripartite-type tricarboxylate transporter receptor subunit TctC
MTHDAARIAPTAASATRRRLLRVLAAASLGLPALRPRAQPGDAFPSRPITLWVPWPAGGATDLTLRLLAELAGRHLGQKVMVDNRAGAGGTLAMPILQQALPDGHTIAQMPQPVLRAPYLQRLLWDPIRDTTPIIQLSGVTFGMVTQPASGMKSLDEVLAYARAHPGELTVATNGVGTTPHLAMDELMASQGLSYVHVPYKGTAEQMVAVASGQVMIGLNSNGFAPFVDSGRLRLLLTLGEQRTRRWPHVPTLKELGHNIVAMSPYGLAGPRGLTAPVVQTLHDAFKAALVDPAHVAELAKYDQEVAYLGPDDYARALRDGFAAEKRNVERLGLVRGLG